MFIKKVCGYLSGGIPTILLSFVACILSLFTVISCDYVRLNFDSINEFNRVFKDPSWFGLGFLNIQDYDEGKTATYWEHNTTCYTYDELSIEHFRSNSIKTALGFGVTSLIMTFLVFILAAVLMCLKKSKTRLVIRGFGFVLSLLSFIFQLCAFRAVFDDENGGVCDPSSYVYFYDSYPHLEFPEIRYMRFFKECTRGPGSRIAVAAAIFQIFTTVWLALNMCVTKMGTFEDKEGNIDATKVDKSMYDSVIPVEDIPIIKPKVAFVDNEEVTEQNVKFSEPPSPPSPLRMPYNGETEKVPSSPNSEKTHPAFEEMEVVESASEEETIPLTIAAVKSEESAQAVDLIAALAFTGGISEDNVQEVDIIAKKEEDMIAEKEEDIQEVDIIAEKEEDVQEVDIIAEKEEIVKGEEEDILKKEEDVEEGTEVKREDFEKVEDIEEEEDLPPLVQKKAPETKDAKIAEDAEPQIAKKEEEIGDKEDVGEEEEVEEEEANDAADALSLYTTDVRKEGEATVGNVRIASMKSGRF
jgi:ABC-type sugar transport system permease subunit